METRRQDVKKFALVATAALLTSPGIAVAGMDTGAVPGSMETMQTDPGLQTRETIDDRGLGYPQEAEFEDQSDASDIKAMNRTEVPDANATGPEAALEGGALPGMDQSGFDTQVIRDVQQALDRRGYNPGIIDGIYGPNTQAAIEDFQRSSGLSVTGRLNQSTLQRLGIRTATTDRGKATSPRTQETGPWHGSKRTGSD